MVVELKKFYDVDLDLTHQREDMPFANIQFHSIQIATINDNGVIGKPDNFEIKVYIRFRKDGPLYPFTHGTYQEIEGDEFWITNEATPKVDGTTAILHLGLQKGGHRHISNRSDKASALVLADPLPVSQKVAAHNPIQYEDDLFVVGEDGLQFDFNTDLGFNSTKGFFQNRGAATILLSRSFDGITYGSDVQVLAGSSYEWEDESIDSIIISHVADSAYTCEAI